MKRSVRGLETAFDDTGGNGVPLVLVHGFPLDRTVWTAQATGLAGAARVIAPDLRGFGESPMPDGPATMYDYAADVAALLDALSIERAVIGGVSMGGYVAFAFRRLFPGRVTALVLVDTRPGPDSPEARRARDDAAAVARTEGVAAVAARMLPKMLAPETAEKRPEVQRSLHALMARQSRAGVVAALAAMRDRPDSTPDLARIAVPTLVVAGAEDALIAPSESEAMAKAIPGARLAMIAGAGHLPNWEAPNAFNDAVRAFVASLG
jgi:pimeloyl-ACP methyl ester carboxylesterase